MNWIIVSLSILLIILLIPIIIGNRSTKKTTDKANDTSKNVATDRQKKSSWWNPPIQAFIIGMLLIGIFYPIFPEQVLEIIKDPKKIAVIIITVGILCIAGRAESFIKFGRVCAGILLAALLVVCIFWPAAKEKFPELNKKDNVAAAYRAPTTSTVISQLPAGAIFKARLAPREKIYLTRGNMVVPPPKLLAKFNDEFIDTSDNWPHGDILRSAVNSTTQSYDLYVILEQGQSITISDTDPRLAKQEKTSNSTISTQPATSTPKSAPIIKQRTTNDPDCLLDKAFEGSKK